VKGKGKGLNVQRPMGKKGQGIERSTFNVQRSTFNVQLKEGFKGSRIQVKNKGKGLNVQRPMKNQSNQSTNQPIKPTSNQ
jgi:hypothetical protein